MVVQQRLSPSRVDRIFRAMADRTRRDIVERVLQGEQSVSALAERYKMSFAAVQKHVAVLERAGLAKKHARGRERLVRANVDAIRKIRGLLERYELLWQQRVDRLDALLSEPEHPITPKD
jgi:DNA-binding transcriptional ArsR family regulator